MKYILALFMTLMNSTAWAGKVGSVNLEEIIPQLKIYQPVNKYIESLVSKKNNELKIIKNKIQEKEKLLNSGILNSPGKAQIIKDLENLTQQKEVFIRQAQAEVDTREQELRYPIIKKILLTIKYIAQQDKYDLIIEDSTPILEQTITIYNLNEKVILLLNN